MKKAKKKSLLLAVALMSSMTNFAFAEEAEGEIPEYQLGQIIVTATRSESKKVDTPANVSVVDAEKIESRGYKTVAEALEDVPGARVSTVGVAAMERVVHLNGDERVLILVDGKRVNTNMGTMTGAATFDMNTLPPMEMIDRIEVVKGAGGALYGADAVGGVVNIITKKIDSGAGSVKVGFGSWGAREYGVSYGGRKDKTSIMIAADRQQQNAYKYKDHKSGDVKKWPSETNYSQEKVSLRVSQELSEDTSLSVGYDYSKLDGNQPGSVTSAYPAAMDKLTNNITARYDWGLAGVDKGYVQIYRNYYSYYNGGQMKETDIGIDVQNESTLSDKHKLVYGASWYNGKGENELSYNGSKTIKNTAIFVQDQWKLDDSWQVNAGLRYDKHNKAGGKTTGSIAVNKKFNETSNAYLSWGQVFKAPTIDDLYYYQDMGSWGKWVGDENLKPEKGDVWSIGYNTNTSPSTQVSISGFYSRLNDAIDWYTSDFFNYTATNINRQRKHGIELSATHKLNDVFDLEASYTYLNVENDLAGAGYEKDRKIAPNIYRAGIRFHDDRWNVSLFARGGTGADTTATTSWGSTTQNYLSSKYITMDIAAKYKVTKDLNAYINIYNLNNAAYVQMAGAVNGVYSNPMAARRIIGGLEYKF